MVRDGKRQKGKKRISERKKRENRGLVEDYFFIPTGVEVRDITSILTLSMGIPIVVQEIHSYK